MLRRSTALVVTALVTGALSAPTSAASAAAQTCQGRPATIVGTGPDIQGTPGDDVIVTGTSQFTHAGAGNDLVCVSSSAAYVYADDGDDVVDASQAGATQINAYLGTGIDRYLGGVGEDLVHAEGTDDTVTDVEWAYLTLTRTSATGTSATGAPGSYTGDAIAVWSTTHDVIIDLKANTVTVDGVDSANLAGIVDANVVAPFAVLRGNPEDNVLSGSGCDLLFFGNGGNDTLTGGHSVEDAPDITSDCATMKATMRGGAGNDDIKGSLGQNRLIGNEGKDTLQGRSRSDVLIGGSGRDTLKGGNKADVLRGGAGRDVADGQNGRDLCVAERERRCER